MALQAIGRGEIILLMSEIDAEALPKRVYLDQNVYGHMLDEGGGDWRKSKVGEVLDAAKQQGKGLVWIGPTHVLETIVATEDARRRDLARTMLEVVDFTRFWHGYELEVVCEVFDFLSDVSARSVRTRYFVERELLDVPRIWLGALALLALGAPASTSQADVVRRRKLENRLLHARFATDQNGWVDRMVQAAKGWQTTRQDVFADVDAMKLPDIEAEIALLRDEVKRLDKKHYDRLKKERAVIAAAYGALDVSAALDSMFDSPMSLDLTLDTGALVADWPAFQKTAGARSMPKDVVAAPPEKRAFDDNMRVAIIDVAIQVWASNGPLTAGIAYESLLRELQEKLHDRELPTQGVIFDADHAGCLRCVDVFYTEDKLFGTIARELAKIVHERTKGAHSPAVGTSPAELAELLNVAPPA